MKKSTDSNSYCIRDNSIMGSSVNYGYARLQLLYQYLKNELMLYDNQLQQLDFFPIYYLLLVQPQMIIKINESGCIELFDKLLIGSRIIIWIDKEWDLDNNIYSPNYIERLNDSSYDYIVIRFY